MPLPIIYGSDMSPAVRTVLLTAHAIGLDYEWKQINPLTGEHKTDEFLTKNPQHTIPTLEDDGKIIWDSHAISAYLIGKYGDHDKDDSFYPKDLYIRAMVDQRLHFESSVLSTKIKVIGMALKQKNMDALNRAKVSVLEAYDFLEKFLANGTYMVGDSVTIADFSIVTMVTTINVAVPVDVEKFPKLSEWLKRMESILYFPMSNAAGLQKAKEHIEKIMAAADVKPL